MKILVLLPESPNPWSSAPARYYAPALRELAARGHDLTVLAVNGGPARDGLAYFRDHRIRFRLFDPPRARPFLARKLRSLWRSGWELACSDFGAAARAEMRDSYDVILAEHPAAARVVEDDPRVLLSLHCLRHVDLGHDRGSPIQEGWRQRRQARRAELSTCRRVQKIRVVSARLAHLVRAEGITADVTVVPLCIDPHLYPSLPSPGVPTVGVIGSMYWSPSRRAAIHFLDDIAPRLRRAWPGVRFLVAGWEARRFLGERLRVPDVEVLDSFQHPVEAFGRLSALVYAPPVGTGMKVKVLEAMAYGVPAIVNGEGFEGLEADPEPPVCLARTDDQIVDGVLTALSDVTARARYTEAARRCLERSFSPAAIVPHLQALLEGCRP